MLEEARARGEISPEVEKKAQEAILTTRMVSQPIKPPPDNVRSAQAQNTAGEQPSGGRRRPTATKLTPRRSSSVRRRPLRTG